jgi:hypothetical protein
MTKSGRQIRPPGERWRADTQHTRNIEFSPSPLSSDSEASIPAAILIHEPSSYHHAKSSPYWSDWKNSMKDELQSIRNNDVWEVVPRPTN